jgi:hypothetical protein
VEVETEIARGRRGKDSKGEEEEGKISTYNMGLSGNRIWFRTFRPIYPSSHSLSPSHPSYFANTHHSFVILFFIMIRRHRKTRKRNHSLRQSIVNCTSHYPDKGVPRLCNVPSQQPRANTNQNPYPTFQISAPASPEDEGLSIRSDTRRLMIPSPSATVRGTTHWGQRGFYPVSKLRVF